MVNSRRYSDDEEENSINDEDKKQEKPNLYSNEMVRSYISAQYLHGCTHTCSS